MPLYSVIIPTYNRAEMLNEALLSVANQSVQDFEIIVVDNYSTDNTSEVARGYDKVKYVVARNNGVIGASRNIGLDLAKGDYIAFLDDDDVWRDDKMDVCIEAMEDGDVRLVCHGVEDYVSGRKHLPQKEVTYGRLLSRGNRDMTMSSVVAHRSIFDRGRRFQESADLIGGEDFALWLDIMYPYGTNKTVATGIQQVLGKIRPGGFSSQRMRDQICAEVAAYNYSFSKNGRSKDADKYLALVYFRGAKRVGRKDIRLASNLVIRGFKALRGVYD